MKFDSRDAHEQPISPSAKKELKLIEDKGFEIGQKYFGKKEGDERTILLILRPMFCKTKDTTYEPVKRRFIDGRWRDADYEVYHTPHATGTTCLFNYKDADGKYLSCSPTEFVKWMSEKEFVEADDSRDKMFPERIPEPTMNMVTKQAKANKNRKVMPDITFDDGDK